MGAAEVIKKIKKIDCRGVSEKISSSLRAHMLENGRKTAVIGISGGTDSAVTAALCSTALGRENVLGIILPSPATAKSDIRDAEAVISKLGIKGITINLSDALKEIEGRIEKHGKMTRVEKGNLMARLRMTALYSFAHSEEGIVVGTGDKSELRLGYFTKYGDGGCDILPIGGLYKTQVREIARYLGLPKNVVEKPSSPGFWPGHVAEEEIGAAYEQIDTVLWCIENGWERDKIEKLVGPSVLKLVLSAMKKSAHKRKMPDVIRV
jgi:NAD+ synthase